VKKGKELFALLRGLSLFRNLGLRSREYNRECRLVRYDSDECGTPYIRGHRRQQGLTSCHAQTSQLAS
jgi:hypothetical protein